MDARDGDQIQSVQEMIGRFTAELISKLEPWKNHLHESPEELEAIEKDVHRAFDRGADMVVAGLVATVIANEEFQQRSEQTRKGFSCPLQKGRERTIAVRLLGGMLIWATTLYCSPRKKDIDDQDDQRQSGLDITLAEFGFGKGVSPGLQSLVARRVALSPSISFAHKEMIRDGIQLDTKTVKRIAYQCGEDLLHMRRHHIELFRQGKLPTGKELVGKRVSVQIDGGRMKIRGEIQEKSKTAERVDPEELLLDDASGRSQKPSVRTYTADWREPKLVTIFIHDKHGKMVKKSKATIDGTLLGPDAIAEVVAMHLHRLGAASANSVTFVADGAPWIWDRISTIIRLAKLSNVRTYEVLDCCHAVHHISLALASLGLSREDRNPLYRYYRSLLRNGQWRQVVEELSSFQSESDPNRELATEIAYLQRHGEAGRLGYVYFRAKGIPCGSGAVESSIRRVINLRLKSNAMFWKLDNAEVMLQVRSQVLTDRWDDRMVELVDFRRTQAKEDWHWELRNMSYKIENSTTVAV